MSPSCSYDDDTAEAATANLDNSGRETSLLISASLVPAIILARGGGKHEEQHGQHDEAREHVEEDDEEVAEGGLRLRWPHEAVSACHAHSVANSATTETNTTSHRQRKHKLWSTAMRTCFSSSRRRFARAALSSLALA